MRILTIKALHLISAGPLLLPEIEKGKKYKQLKDEFIITSGGFVIISDNEKNIQTKI